MKNGSIVHYYRQVAGVCAKQVPDDIILLLNDACDSRLEVLSALAVLKELQKGAEAEGLEGVVRLHSDSSIHILEPWATSPTECGASVGFITVQHPHEGYVWDFCVWRGYNNGHGIDQCEPCLLVDIDGFAVHRKKRKLDLQKLFSTRTPAARFREEAFKSMEQLAQSILFNSIWNDEWGGECAADCPYCDAADRADTNFGGHKNKFAHLYSPEDDLNF